MTQIALPHAVTPFTLTTVNRGAISVPVSGARFTHLQFRRFAGCPICNLHLRSFSARAEELAAAGIAEVIFFHSSLEALQPYADGFPFALVADPKRERYRAFGVERSLRALLHPRAMGAALRGVFRFGPTLKVENGPLGLPADFLFATDGRFIAVKYGTHADDQWSVDELLRLAAET